MSHGPKKTWGPLLSIESSWLVSRDPGLRFINVIIIPI